MNPLTAQSISRHESSQRYQSLTTREPSRFQTPRFKAFAFISKVFTTKARINAQPSTT